MSVLKSNYRISKPKDETLKLFPLSGTYLALMQNSIKREGDTCSQSVKRSAGTVIEVDIGKTVKRAFFTIV
jgi:hypothetical protein